MNPSLRQPLHAVVWGLFLLLASAFAQLGIGVAPPRFDLLVSPGGTATRTLTVFSREGEEQQIVPAVHDWLMDANDRIEWLPPATTNYSAAPWLELALDPFALPGGASKTVRFTLRVPKDEGLDGSYWTAIALTTEARPRTDATGKVFATRVRAMVIVYVTVQGTEQPAAELQGITVVTGEEDGKRFLVADVVNKGNVYLRLNGELRFVNTKGEVIKRTPLPERVLLREGLVRYELPIPPDLPEDTVLAAIEIQPQGPAGGYGGPPLYGEVALP